MFSKKSALLLSSLLLLSSVFSQKDSSGLRISVLTCAPGEELYSIFGHSAIRVVDSLQHFDIVYNYGMFDYADPDFYTKFASGKLDYFLAVQGTNEFMLEYLSDQRDVTEQVLGLSPAEKNTIVKALNDNLKGPARFYKYDFLYDNCTTRVRDLLTRYGAYSFDHALVPPGTTYRGMLHEYLDRGGAAWSKLGIDLLLSLPADRPVNARSALFLPDYLMKGIDSSTHAGSREPVAKKNLLNKGADRQDTNIDWPLYVFTVLAVVIVLLSLSKNGKATAFVRGADFILFFLTGTVGCLLLCLWLYSDHAQYKYNFNLVWALPTHLVAAFFRWKKPGWLRNYWTLCVVVYIIALLAWFWLPQQMNPALLPLVALLLQRCVALRKK